MSIQFIIKDGRGDSRLVHNKIPSYRYVAREMATLQAIKPYTVWRHETLTGERTYDGRRTQSLSDAVRGLK